MAQVTDASVDLDSAATISDHDTTGLLECSAVCCSNEMEAYQPKQKAIFQQISKNGRYFTCSWYEKNSWITLCLTKKVFCLYCRYCHKHNTFLQAANKCHDAFTTRGFDNIKKACDLVIQELHDRFGQREVIKPIVTLESLLLKSANGEECIQELYDFNDFVYRQEFTVEKVEKQLGILVDVIHVELPEVKQVTIV